MSDLIYQFSDAQMAQIDRLASGTDASVFNNVSRPISGVYAYILSLISIDGNSALGPTFGISPGVWQWFRGATLINRRLR